MDIEELEGLKELPDGNNYYKFLNSIIHRNEFLNNEYDSTEENEQYVYFNQPSEYKYEDVPTIIVDQVSKKDKPKSNFYKYLFSSVLIVTSAITVSYFFSKKRNKNKN